MDVGVVGHTFIGRKRELGILRSALADAEGGQPQAMFLAGESGIGKTRLLAEAGDLAARAGFRVLRGSCLGVGLEGVPYAAVAEALRGLFLECGPEEADALFSQGRAEFSRPAPRPPASTSPTSCASWKCAVG